MMVKRRVPDAADSNAGDDFHILWTMRKCIELINFNDSGLKAIAVENLSQEDSSITSESPEMFLGVDLTEYYAGTNFEKANRVIISQLKYSTRHPNKKWTLSSICSGKAKGPKGSIIHRLADIFKEITAKSSTDDIRKKLTIKLVSNRPADQKLTDLLRRVNLLTNSSTGKSKSLVAIKKLLSIKDAETLTFLEKASFLKSPEFCIFLQLLDFSDCGSDTRFALEQKLVISISSFTSFKSTAEFNYLNRLIGIKTLPDSANQNTIKLSDVLLAFELPDISYMFPVGNEVELPHHRVPRTQLDAIMLKVKDQQRKLICLHGPAGIGKSTLISSIPDLMPQGSVNVVIDCYGRGKYLDPDDGRHLHEQAITQICNELAIETGSPFLLNRGQDNIFYLKELKKRIISVLDIIAQGNPDAHLLLLIDAADNSVTAAEKSSSQTFVHDLVNLDLPPRVKIIISARSERLPSLRLPGHVSLIEMLQFDHQETASFLHGRFASISDKKIDEFLKLTNGIPRVMAYAMGLSGGTLELKMKILKPDGKNLEEIFRLQIHQAARKSELEKVSAVLRDLIALPRPVPMHILAKTTKVTESGIKDIVTDLWTGLILNDNEFSFRDEDFETYLRSQYVMSLDDNIRVAIAMLESASIDNYSSTHLGDFLERAGMNQELTEIVLGREHLSFPLDPIKNKDVYISRTRLAMKFADRTNDNLDLLKLLIVAAEAAKTNQVLEDVLLNSAELAADYGNFQTNQKIYFQPGNPRWFGSAHFKNAAVYSKNKRTWEIAKRHLIKAEEWMSYRSKLSDEEIEQFHISNNDIACGMESVFNLSGPQKAADWLSRWKPKAAIYESLEIFLRKNTEKKRVRIISEWVRQHPELRIDLKLLLVATYFRLGIPPPVSVKEILVDLELLKRSIHHFEPGLSDVLLCFVEYAFQQSIDSKLLMPLLEQIGASPPIHPPNFFNSGSDNEAAKIDIFFRKRALLHLFAAQGMESKHLYPERLKKEIKDDHKAANRQRDDRVEFDRIYKYLAPSYIIRAKYLIFKKLRKTAVADAIILLQSLFNDYEVDYYQRYKATPFKKFIIMCLLDIDLAGDKILLSEQISNCVNKNKPEAIDFRLSICEKIGRKASLRKWIPEELVKLEQQLTNNVIAGSEMIGAYTRAAIVGSLCSSELGKHYFDKLVLASNEIDLEAYDQLRLINEIVLGQGPMSSPHLARLFARYTEFCAEKLKGWDGFPWHIIFPTLNGLDFYTSFSTLCRWDHNGVKEWDRHYLELLISAFEHGYLSPEVAVGLLGMNKHHYQSLLETYALIIGALDDKEDHCLKNILVGQIISDLKLHFVPGNSTTLLEGFLSLISSGKFLSKQIVDDFKEFVQSAKLLAPTNESSYAEEKYDWSQQRKDYVALFKKAKKGGDRLLANVIALIETSNENRHVNFELMFQVLTQDTVVADPVAILEELLELSPDHLTYHNFQIGLKAVAQKWKHNPQVEDWNKNALDRILVIWFDIFFGDEHFRYETVQSLANTLGLDRGHITVALLKLIPENLEHFSTVVLYQLLHNFTHLVTTDQKSQFLAWTLERWSENIPVDFAPLEDKGGVITDQAQIIGNLLRYFLGHPKKSLRWMAGHVIRRLAESGETCIIIFLLEKQDIKEIGAFQHQKFPFFWISAKMYLWIALSRIASESPAALEKTSAYFIKETESTALPHAIIKLFLRKAALSMANSVPEFLDDVSLGKLIAVLNSKIEKIPKDNSTKKRSKRQTRETRFKFDPMDTLPSWYRPLGEIFSATESEVAMIADKFITENWGYIGDPHKEDHVHSDDYDDTSNKDGDEPDVENLQLYYEFHSMCCAAFELLQTQAQVDTSDYYPETWEEWLAGWDTYWPNRWLADGRDPVPHHSRYWHADGYSAEWEWAIQPADFDDLFRFNPDGMTTVHLGANTSFGKDKERASIRSGLVEPELGQSLLYTLQTFSDEDNYIPMEEEGGEDFEERQQKSEPFTIEGWIIREGRDERGIDEHDPLFYEIEKGSILPGEKFRASTNSLLSADGRKLCTVDTNSCLARQVKWNCTPGKEHYSNITSGGSYTEVNTKTLLLFLNQEKKSLIIQVNLKRSLDRGRSEYYPAYTKIFLLNLDGTITTSAANNKSW